MPYSKAEVAMEIVVSNEPVLEVYPELILRGKSPKQLDDFIENLKAALPSGWSHELVDNGLGKENQFRLEFGHKALRFRLWTRPPVEMFVQGIIPEDMRDNIRGDLTEYQNRLRQFADLVEPVAASADLEVIFQTTEAEITNFIPEEVANRLRSFSHCANKGSLHPLDERRWFEFIFEIHDAGLKNKLTSELLQQWLFKDGWGGEGSRDLSSRYDAELRVLQEYDRHRNGLSLS